VITIHFAQVHVQGKTAGLCGRGRQNIGPMPFAVLVPKAGAFDFYLFLNI
jgi:hypothetical protein